MRIKNFHILTNESLSFSLHRGAGKYGEGTYISEDINFEVAKKIANHFKMTAYNTPRNTTIDDIENMTEDSTDYSVGSNINSEFAFIYLVKNYKGLYDLYVGPRSVELVKSFLNGNIGYLDFSDIEDYFDEVMDEVYKFKVYYEGIDDDGDYVVIIESDLLIDLAIYDSIGSFKKNLDQRSLILKCLENLTSQKEMKVNYIEKRDRNSLGYRVDHQLKVCLKPL